MRKTTVKGTRDYLPQETALRDALQARILEVYRRCGFERMQTPALESIENLEKSEGGENLGLLFRILKRGDKLETALKAGQAAGLCDIGLRYDLTLPLCRFYANNRSRLLLPFKCIQLDRVYRAEQPQRGRDREFVQCDIDILGDASSLAEIELMDVTAQALLAVGLRDFTIRVNDRRLLLAMLRALGFAEDSLHTTCMAVDKLDKLGAEGVRKELLDRLADPDATAGLCALLAQGPVTLEHVAACAGAPDCAERLTGVLRAVSAAAEGRYAVRFDWSLVRGQGYYTGTVFEIECGGGIGSLGGGGRYDGLIGKFTGEPTPAVGFSIGFERLYTLFVERGLTLPSERSKVALLYEGEDYAAVRDAAERLRQTHDVTLFAKPKKLGRFLNTLAEKGFEGFVICGERDVRPLHC